MTWHDMIVCPVELPLQLPTTAKRSSQLYLATLAEVGLRQGGKWQTTYGKGMARAADDPSHRSQGRMLKASCTKMSIK